MPHNSKHFRDMWADLDISRQARSKASSVLYLHLASSQLMACHLFHWHCHTSLASSSSGCCITLQQINADSRHKAAEAGHAAGYAD